MVISGLGLWFDLVDLAIPWLVPTTAIVYCSKQHIWGTRQNTENGGCDCAVNGRIKPRTGIVCGERVVCAWNGCCFAENGLLGFPVCLWSGLDNYTNCTLIYDLLWKVGPVGCAICFIYIDWWGTAWPIVACPFRALVVLYRMLPISI